jgi:hypothetical protein
MMPAELLPRELAYADDGQPRWEHADVLGRVLVVLQYGSPLFMLVFFLAAFTLRSIAASNSNTNIAKPTTTGPGGKPLPATDPTRNFVKKTIHDDVTHTQKRLFEWVSLATALTFFSNSVLVIAQALAKQSEHWWCGKPVVVCRPIGEPGHALGATEADLLPSRSTSLALSSSTVCSLSRCSTRNPRPP